VWESCSFEEQERFLDWLLNRRESYNGKYKLNFSMKIESTSSDFEKFLSDWDDFLNANVLLMRKDWRDHYVQKKKIINEFRYKNGYTNTIRIVCGIENIWNLSSVEIRSRLNNSKYQKLFPHILAVSENERKMHLEQKAQTDYVNSIKRKNHKFIVNELYDILKKIENKKKIKIQQQELEIQKQQSDKESDLKSNLQKLQDELNDEDW
jgi:hypothetical protein